MDKKCLSRSPVVAMSCAAIAISLGGAIWMWFALRAAGPGPFILGFDDMQGITRTGGMGDVSVILAVAVAVAVINAFVALELDARDPWLGKMVAGITLAAAVLLFIAFAAIINAN